MCCSGFAAEGEDDNGVKFCKLPLATDLNVYFNKFVSGEGITPGEISHLTEEDFDESTGEPKLNSEVLAKLKDLGEEHCVNGTVRRGGAFGSFESSPVSSITVGSQTGSHISDLYSIVDEIGDENPEDSPSPTGLDSFTSGFRWNHHVYCDVPK